MDTPRGILIAIGGGEDKERHKKVLKRFIEETDRRDPYIEVITTATNLPEEVDTIIQKLSDLLMYVTLAFFILTNVKWLTMRRC